MNYLRSLTVVLFLCSLRALVAQPANEHLTNRVTLVGGISAYAAGTTAGASTTREAGEVTVSGLGNTGHGRTVWYEWTPTLTGQAFAYVGGNSRFIVAVWSGDAHPLTQVAAARAPGFGQFGVANWNAVAGTSYKIMVDSSGFGQGGTFDLYVQFPPPAVTITSPTNGQAFTNVPSIVVSANATSQMGTVTNVEFYTESGALIGRDTSAPYSVVWNNPPLGSTNIYAYAWDSAGLIGGSPFTTVHFRPFGYAVSTLIATGSVWRYLDNGTDQGENWRALGFDDAAWKTGRGELGYGDNDEATVIEDNPTPGYSNPATDRYITTYFRHTFQVASPQNVQNLVVNVRRDDGAVVYLNGTEVFRTGMPGGTVNYLTLANNANDEVSFFSGSVNPALLNNGANVLAVEIHQSSADSSDVSFELRLDAEIVDANQAPSVTITNPANGALFQPGATITINASAIDNDGTVTNVAFYAGLTKLGDDTSAPFSFTWNGVPQGNYTLTAVATDNSGASRTSPGVDITVNTFQIVPVTLVPAGSVWRYLDDGSDQGTAWQQLGFNDSGWSNGPAQLGYSVPTPESDEATVIRFGPNTSAKWTNYYFRHQFTVTNASAISNLTLRVLRDDGAVVYINGVEVRRDNMPLGAISSTTLASAAVDAANESTFFATTNSVALINGTNVIAVEIHQNSGTSSDVSFDLELIANTIRGERITNTVPPFVQAQVPAAGSTVSSLSQVQVNFSETVSGVDAADLLVNGVPATGVSGSANVFTFTFPQPALGTVNFTWALGHGITDQGDPVLPLDGASTTNRWSYTLVDNVAPTIAAKSPAAGATITNLNAITVEFSEAVQGVNASDLLINGSPAVGLTAQSASTYTFSFSPASPGLVNVTWASGHGITDLSPSANPFSTNSPGANWSYFVQNRIVLVASNDVYRYAKGTNEPSNPVDQWRFGSFDDSSWLTGAAPFYYDNQNLVYTGNTVLSDMQNNYTTVYLRRHFTVANPAGLTNLTLRWRCDDGFICYINGIEKFRMNSLGGAGASNSFVPYTASAGNNTAQATYTSTVLGLGGLIAGTNTIAFHLVNAGAASSDILLDVELVADALDNSATAPSIAAVNPSAGEVFSLTNITITFNEPVTNIDAADLRINGIAATSVVPAGSSNGASYTFAFAQPAYGLVNINWAAGHGITDRDAPPKPFDATAPGSTFTYTLVNPSAPVVFARTPAAGSTVTNLTSITVVFSEAVQGVNASDLLVNGSAASGVTGSGSNYTFNFAHPAYGNVAISWAAGHGIRDVEAAQNAFAPARSGNTWQYTLIDRTAPTIVAKNPPAGANVTNLTSLSVTFSENVQGVHAFDLLVNAVPATGVSGGGSNYTFTFAQPNTTVANITWALNHGISDTAAQPNFFNGAAPGETWQYFTPDNVPPTVIALSPPSGATVRELAQLSVTFAEPVVGVSAADLLVNSQPAQSVSGSGAGPYTFVFTQPATGAVQVAWANNHGITDFASPANPFAGGDWSYVLDPNAVFAGKVVISELMFHPSSRNTNDEWIEFYNTDTAPVNLNGWKITRGVSFTFPSVVIPARGYLVVAANVDRFQTQYPGVANVVGNWTGTLGNNDETIELQTSLGETVDEVRYATEGDWATRRRMVVGGNGTHFGWVWQTEADALGKSLELRNPALPNTYGHNWNASLPAGGTPGANNSVASTNISPIVTRLEHFPTVPRSTDSVVVTARLIDEQPGTASATLFYRNAATLTPDAFIGLPMYDDGAHNDGIAGDGVFAATVPPQTNDAVIEFYVEAVDAGLRTNTYPAPAIDQNGVLGQFANALYQVDDRTYAFAQPLYKFIMTEQERVWRDEIARFDAQSDAEMNTTFISIEGTGTELRYNCSIRERGAGSRGYVPANHRINIPNDRRWKGQSAFNLNTRFTHSQMAGYLLSWKSGLDTEWARAVRVRLNNRDEVSAGAPQYGVYVHLEAPGAELADAHWPLDSGGNVYRAGGARQATLAYLGTNFVSYQNAGYDKASNSSENDWNDLFNLTFALSANTPDSNYTAAVRSIVNVEQWMLYLAMDALLVNMETTIANGDGDDYTMYFAPREKRFYMVAHDWDTVLNQGDTAGSVTTPIFRANNLASMNRFMNWPEFRDIYYATLRRLANTTFSPAELGKTLDEGLGSFVPQNVINAMKTFASNRVNYVLSILPPDTNAPTAAPLTLGGTITSNVILKAASGPFTITSTLTVGNGATLTIEPGAVVRFSPGTVGLVVANGGRLIAEGTAASPILFTRANGGSWSNIIINGSVGSPESRIRHARIEFNVSNTSIPAIDVNAGTVVLDNLTFGNTAAPYIHVDGASFVISHCYFPSSTAAFEPVHGTQGVKAGGRGIFYRNYFGKTLGYNDSVDFTGGNRPGPIVEFLDNVFTGSDDDIIDLDGTDAWVEGNIFMHVHRNGSPDSASGVSGGSDSGDTSEITIVGNIFFDVDQAATAKQGNFYTFINNTVVHQTGAGFADSNVAAVLNFADDGYALARGMYVEGNVFADAQRLVRAVTNGTALYSNVTFNNNFIPKPWTGPGTNNSLLDPRLKRLPFVSETASLTNWLAAQVLRDWFSLQSNSPALATGPLGSDRGGVIPMGVRAQARAGVGPADVVFEVGFNRTGNGIPAANFPNGSGYTHYQWRLDDGPWSSELPIGTPINVPGFRSGAHRVDIVGRRDSGIYQNHPDMGPLATVTSYYSEREQSIRFSELLASNQSAVDHQGTRPDLIELHNSSATTIDLAGLRLSDDISQPGKFVFPANTHLPAGGYLVVYANDPDGTSGFHTGFTLSKEGGSVFLFDSEERGGALIDSVHFGLQITDRSVARIGNEWVLAVPTPRMPNQAAVTGNPARLLINEILTAELTSFPDDFVEVYNPQSVPVAMGGLFFTDNPPHWPDRSPVAPLTFIDANGYIAFRADGNTDSGADHLSFSLDADRGIVALLNRDYSTIDCFLYGPQTTDISQGRSPNNNATTNLFVVPTPGAPNPAVVVTNLGVVINEVLAANGSIAETDGSAPDWVEFFNNGTNAVDLSEMSLSDTPTLPRKYVFPVGSVIPGRGYFRLRCDGDLPASSTNTGFNLKAEGGALYLYDKPANAQAQINVLSYGLQAVDYAVGRVPDGTGAFVLTVPTPSGGNIAAALASANSVKVNEWMASPASGSDWFELWNPNPQPVAIGGYHLTDNLNNRTKSPIPALSFLGGSTNGYQRFWADNSPISGANHVAFALSTTEAIGFATPSGSLIDAVSYTNQAANVSEGRFPDGSATIVRFPQTASPGDPNYLVLGHVVINEALTHTDPPLEDAIEVRNLANTNVNIGGWWLSDSRGNLRKYRIPDNTILPANGYRVFYEFQFNNDPTNNPNAFSLSSANGDQIYLSTASSNGALTGYRAFVDFGAAQNGVSFGRYVTSDGRQEFVAISTRSLGQDDPSTVNQFRTGTGLVNPYPRVGPVVIGSIHYHPPDIGTNDNVVDEFIELRNITGAPVPLYDPAYPTNTWRLRDAVDYDFPQGVSLPANGRLFVVSFDPVADTAQLYAFRSRFSVDSTVPVFGPYSGRLANGDENVELYRPDVPNVDEVPYVLVERVEYDDATPWPAADGTGAALFRVSLTGFGNDPTNWVATVPNFGGPTDTDSDGMPDSFENAYGLNRLSPFDAHQDLDGDGSSNLQEYLAGTSPNNAASALRILSIGDLSGTARLTFLAASNRTYTIEYKNALNDPAWTRLTDITSAPTNRLMLINTVVPGTNRFFRARTPQLP
jgi:hypothetical protein